MRAVTDEARAVIADTMLSPERKEWTAYELARRYHVPIEVIYKIERVARAFGKKER